MKLFEIRVREFKSIWDSGPLRVDRATTCLVGKNEAGKTALLEAMYRLNPIIAGDGNFDDTDDYPRSMVEDYSQEVESGRRHPATVITATFQLEPSELNAIALQLGESALTRPEVTLSKGYKKAGDGRCELQVSVPLSEAAIVQYLVESFQVPQPLSAVASKMTKLAQLSIYLNETSKRQEQELKTAIAAANQLTDAAERAAALEFAKALAESEQAKALRARLVELMAHKNLGLHVWHTYLEPGFPKFLYFDEYYQMEGRDNIQALQERQERGELKPSDYPLLGLLDLARLNLDQLLNTTRTQGLKNKLQGASNHLSGKILRYWSQNKHLRMHFDVRPALPNDPPGMQEGTNIWGEVFDSKHLTSTGLHSRSTGFVWFFSFLSWYSAQKKQDQPLVLLLDEPGLSLHAKAQDDLLRYFEAEIAGNPRHQLIYTTHSPFMVDPAHFERVRIIQDKSIDSDTDVSGAENGTKVITNLLEAGEDSLLPLQGALGYELHQGLFIGPNCLVVEGVPDLLYIQVISSVLHASARTGLDSRWTITPVGGAKKVPTFAALIGVQRGLRVATLIDFQKSNQPMIENLCKKMLLEKTHVLTFADFTGTKEADVEDMFGDDFYLDLVNAEYACRLSSHDVNGGSPRIRARLAARFARHPLPNGAPFDPYRPARLLSEKVAELPIPDEALDRFEAAFKQLNALLPGV
jgi:ABC-type cobalamin/Fe3+-siderophores transport system ATPase subunit